MKPPKYFVETMEQAINLGLNAFAMQLIGESFADAPAKFGDENVAFLAHAHPQHKGSECSEPHRHQSACCDSDCWCKTGGPIPLGPSVWFIMSKTMPTAADFDPPATAMPNETDA